MRESYCGHECEELDETTTDAFFFCDKPTLQIKTAIDWIKFALFASGLDAFKASLDWWSQVYKCQTSGY